MFGQSASFYQQGPAGGAGSLVMGGGPGEVPGYRQQLGVAGHAAGGSMYRAGAVSGVGVGGGGMVAGGAPMYMQGAGGKMVGAGGYPGVLPPGAKYDNAVSCSGIVCTRDCTGLISTTEPTRQQYVNEPTYQYVGLGAGEFEVVRPPQTPVSPIVLASIAVFVVLAAVAVIFTPDVTTTTPTPTGPPSSCLIWGDPHVDTFDHRVANWYDEGDYWIVKSEKIFIQGRYKATPYTNGLAATFAVALGGPFLLGHTIVVEPIENEGRILVDGAPALSTFPSDMELSGGVRLSYNGQGNVVDSAQTHLEKHIVHMDLPWGVKVQVLRWANHINIRITMTPREGGQDGHCGNFNGQADDDSTEAIKGRIGTGIVPLEESLFHHRWRVRAGPHKSVDECRKNEPAKYKQAMKDCLAEEPNLRNDDLLRGCVFDVCFAGTRYAAQDGISESAQGQGKAE